MRKLTFEEAKKVDVGVLDAIARFCEENNLGYFLNFGTLIGAVRHKGYIPWDDDIDISLLRPDYDKFMATFNDYDPNYKCNCGDNNPKWGIMHGGAWDTRVKGSGIDIFCIDNAPDDDRALKKMLRRYFFYRVLNGAKKGSIFRSFKGFPLHQKILGKILCFVMHILPIPQSYLKKKLLDIAKMYSGENTKRVGSFQGLKPAVIEREKLANTVYAEFEGRQYRIPVGYDEWLRKLYGDYMQLPPKHMQVHKHGSKDNIYVEDDYEIK